MNTRGKIIWTDQMINKLKIEFPYRFNKDLAKDLGVSWRSLIRKARLMEIEKEPNFLDIRRKKITKMATAAAPENPNKGNKDFRIPGGEKYQFKLGHISSMKDPKVAKKMAKTRNETIRKERERIRDGLPQKTKLRLTRNPFLRISKKNRVKSVFSSRIISWKTTLQNQLIEAILINEKEEIKRLKESLGYIL